MDVVRRLLAPTAVAWLALCAPFASAGSLDACAQRVIRDWYRGGRIDKLHPLECYRAAIRALPNDVLQYSNADKDIARALAFARRARDDEIEAKAPAPAPEQPRAEEEQAGKPPAATTTAEPSPSSSARSVPPPPVTKPRLAKPSEPPASGAEHVAAGSEAVEVSAALPYPVIVLAALAGTLLATGAVGRLVARRR